VRGSRSRSNSEVGGDGEERMQTTEVQLSCQADGPWLGASVKSVKCLKVANAV